MIDDVAAHVSERAGSKVPPPTPLHRSIGWAVRPLANRPEPKIPVQSRRHGGRIGRARHSLLPEPAGPVGPDVDLLHRPDHSCLKPLVCKPSPLGGMPLVSHLGGNPGGTPSIGQLSGLPSRPPSCSPSSRSTPRSISASPAGRGPAVIRELAQHLAGEVRPGRVAGRTARALARDVQPVAGHGRGAGLDGRGQLLAAHGRARRVCGQPGEHGDVGAGRAGLRRRGPDERPVGPRLALQALRLDLDDRGHSGHRAGQVQAEVPPPQRAARAGLDGGQVQRGRHDEGQMVGPGDGRGLLRRQDGIALLGHGRVRPDLGIVEDGPGPGGELAAVHRLPQCADRRERHHRLGPGGRQRRLPGGEDLVHPGRLQPGGHRRVGQHLGQGAPGQHPGRTIPRPGRPGPGRAGGGRGLPAVAGLPPLGCAEQPASTQATAVTRPAAHVRRAVKNPAARSRSSRRAG